MEPQTKKKLIIIGSIVVLVGTAVGLYLYKRKSDKDKESTADAGLPSTSDQTNTPSGGGTSSSGASVSTSIPSDKEGIQKFQDWLDKKYPKWLLGHTLNKGSGYGNVGPNTKKAWDTYGAEYRAEMAPKPSGSGFAKGVQLYLTAPREVAYSYPQLGASSAIGNIYRVGGTPAAQMIEDANAKGWIKVYASVKTKDDEPGKQMKVYVPAKSFTTKKP